MPTDPQNNYLPVPVEFGGGPYDDHVNNNFDRLTQHRVVSGPIADRPAPGTWAPQRWYATDKALEYYNTGSSWRVIGGEVTYASSSPGGIQAAIDTVTAVSDDFSLVKLRPGETYDEEAEIHVKDGITLDCRGAEVRISNDHNGFFLDNRAHIIGLTLEIDPALTYTKSAITVNTDRAVDGDYARNPGYSGCSASGILRNANKEGIGLNLRANNGPIGLPCSFALAIYSFAVGLDVAVSEYVNGVRFPNMVFHGTETAIRQQGIGTQTGPFNSIVSAMVQMGPFTDHIVDNQTTEPSCVLEGQMWDTPNMPDTASAVKGPNVSIRTNSSHAREIAQNSPDAGASSAAYGWERGQRTIAELDTGTIWEQQMVGGTIELSRNGTVVQTNTTAGEPEVVGGGDGLIVTTPDGSSRYRIRVDNSGTLVTDAL